MTKINSKIPALATLRLFQVAECKISYSSSIKPGDRPKITCSRDAYDNFKPYFIDFVEHHEEFWAMMLSRSNRVIGVIRIGAGGLAGVVADPRSIYQAAILSNCAGLIVAHNHPSGNTNASQADLDLTKKLREAGKLLEIPLLDHLIILPGSYVSLADEGLL